MLLTATAKRERLIPSGSGSLSAALGIAGIGEGCHNTGSGNWALASSWDSDDVASVVSSDAGTMTSGKGVSGMDLGP